MSARAKTAWYARSAQADRAPNDGIQPFRDHDLTGIPVALGLGTFPFKDSDSHETHLEKTHALVIAHRERESRAQFLCSRQRRLVAPGPFADGVELWCWNCRDRRAVHLHLRCPGLLGRFPFHHSWTRREVRRFRRRGVLGHWLSSISVQLQRHQRAAGSSGRARRRNPRRHPSRRRSFLYRNTGHAQSRGCARASSLQRRPSTTICTRWRRHLCRHSIERSSQS